MKDSQFSDRKLEAILEDAYKDRLFGAEEVRLLAQALKNERADRAKNPGVWDGAPERATSARVRYTVGSLTGHNDMYSQRYDRELPKTKAREIAERTWEKISHYQGDTSAIDDIEAAILEAQKGGE